MRSVKTIAGFDGPAPKVYGRDDWCDSPEFRSIEWVLQRAPSLNKYTVTSKSAQFGAIRTVPCRTVSGYTIWAYFYEEPDGSVVLMDVMRLVP